MRFNKVKSRPRARCLCKPRVFPPLHSRGILELGLEERDYVSERSIGLVETEDSNFIVVSFVTITVH